MLGLLSLGPGDAVIAQTDIVNIPEAHEFRDKK